MKRQLFIKTGEDAPVEIWRITPQYKSHIPKHVPSWVNRIWLNKSPNLGSLKPISTDVDSQLMFSALGITKTLEWGDCLARKINGQIKMITEFEFKSYYKPYVFTSKQPTPEEAILSHYVDDMIDNSSSMSGDI